MPPQATVGQRGEGLGVRMTPAQGRQERPPRDPQAIRGHCRELEGGVCQAFWHAVEQRHPRLDQGAAIARHVPPYPLGHGRAEARAPQARRPL